MKVRHVKRRLAAAIALGAISAYNFWWAKNGEVEWTNWISFGIGILGVLTTGWSLMVLFIDWRWVVAVNKTQEVVDEAAKRAHDAADEYLRVMGFVRWDENGKGRSE